MITKRKRYISQSAIKDFMECSKRYYYRISHPEEAQKTREMAIGNVVHEYLEKYAGTETTNNELSIIMAKHQVPEVLKLSIVSYLENAKPFFTFFGKRDIIEKMFTVPYKDNNFITGKFDRINPDTHITLDWKTGKVSFNMEKDIQSIIYYESYKALYGVYPRVLYAFLKEGRLVEYKPNQLYIDLLYKEIIPNMIEAIDKGLYAPDGLFKYNSCKYCSYRSYCFSELGIEQETK